MVKNRKPQKNQEKPEAPLVEFTEEDQWRIIRDSGVLNKLPGNAENKPEAAVEEEHLLPPFWEEFFAATSLIIPFSCLLLLMEILAHYQYGRKPTMEALANRMIPGVPILCVFIFYTNRYKHLRQLQLFLLVLGIGSGARMLYVLNRSNWRDVMKFCPPLATAWVYAVMQLDIGPAILSLLVVYGFAWYKNFTIFPKI